MKYAVVTGVSGGIGSAAAEKLIREGYTVFGLDLREPETKDGLEFIRTDLCDESSVAEAFEAVRSRTDRLDCIVQMAGIYDLNSLVEMREEDFIRIFNVNLFSLYRINKQFLPLLPEGGRILMTSSELAPLDPLPFTGIYGVTKAAVEKYAYSLRMELQLLGIKVIVLRPGAVATGLLDVSTSRLDSFCENTQHYSCNADRFRGIVNRVEARKIPPERIARLAWKAISAKRPRYVYSINRNPLLLLMNLLPDRLQNAAIRLLLKN